MSKILAFLQALVAKDLTALEASAVTVIVSLVAGLGLHLSGGAVGIVAAIVSAGFGWFVHKHFAAKAKASGA